MVKHSHNGKTQQLSQKNKSKYSCPQLCQMLNNL